MAEETKAAAAEETTEAAENTEKTEQPAAPTEEKPAENTPEPETKAPEEKRFTQAEVDEIVTKRLARESKKAENAVNAENESLKQSLACYKAGVKDDCIDDAVTLAKKLTDDKTDFSAALKKVLEKYPSFKGASPAKPTGVSMSDRNFPASDDALRKAFGLKTK